MMDAYVYDADVYCDECISDVYDPGRDCEPPNGYPDGGGEADTPQHCGKCGVFLENPLTPDGVRYVVEAVDESLYDFRDGRRVARADPGGVALDEWAPYYLEDMQNLARRDPLVWAYLGAALWASCAPGSDRSLEESGYSVYDIAPGTLAVVIADCWEFEADHASLISGREDEAGIDLWLTRNGHGAGFWDGDWPEGGATLDAAARALGEFDLYPGDDGKLYAAGVDR